MSQREAARFTIRKGPGRGCPLLCIDENFNRQGRIELENEDVGLGSRETGCWLTGGAWKHECNENFGAVGPVADRFGVRRRRIKRWIDSRTDYGGRCGATCRCGSVRRGCASPGSDSATLNGFARRGDLPSRGENGIAFFGQSMPDAGADRGRPGRDSGVHTRAAAQERRRGVNRGHGSVVDRARVVAAPDYGH